MGKLKLGQAIAMLAAIVVSLVLSSTEAFARVSPQDDCRQELIRRASLIKERSKDIARQNEDLRDQQLDRFQPIEIPETEKKEAANASDILTALRELQETPTATLAPVLSTLCKNKFSVGETVKQ